MSPKEASIRDGFAVSVRVFTGQVGAGRGTGGWLDVCRWARACTGGSGAGLVLFGSGPLYRRAIRADDIASFRHRAVCFGPHCHIDSRGSVQANGLQS